MTPNSRPMRPLSMLSVSRSENPLPMASAAVAATIRAAISSAGPCQRSERGFAPPRAHTDASFGLFVTMASSVSVAARFGQRRVRPGQEDAPQRSATGRRPGLRGHARAYPGNPVPLPGAERVELEVAALLADHGVVVEGLAVDGQAVHVAAARALLERAVLEHVDHE